MGLFGKKEATPTQTVQVTPAPEPQKLTRLQQAQTALDQVRLVRNEVQKAVNEARREVDSHRATIHKTNQALERATTADDIRRLLTEQDGARREMEAQQAVVTRLEANLRQQEAKVISAEQDVQQVQSEAGRAKSYIKSRKAAIGNLERQIEEARRQIEILKTNQAQERHYMQGVVAQLRELTGETVEE